MGKKSEPSSYVDSNTGKEESGTQNRTSRPWFKRPATYIAAGATALTLGLTSLGMFTKSDDVWSTEKYSYKVPLALQNDTTPEIASIDIGGNQIVINEKDKFIRDLSSKSDFINYVTSSLTDSTTYASMDAFSQISLKNLMSSTNFSKTSLYNLYTNQGDLDFTSAMGNLWMIKKDGKLSKEFFDEADNLTKTYSPSESSLQNYYGYLANEVNDFKKSFNLDALVNSYSESTAFGRQKKRAVENIVQNLNEDVLLSFQMTELFPEVNPLFNYAFMDKFLQGAGEDFLVRIPALHDNYMSFGPFQLTSKVIFGNEGATKYNQFLPEKDRVPGSMIYYDTMDEHVTGALLNMVSNTNYFAQLLGNRGQLTKFNDFYESLPENEQALVATAMYSVMHNNPGRAAKGFANYLKSDATPTYPEFAQQVDFGHSQPYLRKSLRNNLVLNKLFTDE